MGDEGARGQGEGTAVVEAKASTAVMWMQPHPAKVIINQSWDGCSEAQLRNGIVAHTI